MRKVLPNFLREMSHEPWIPKHDPLTIRDFDAMLDGYAPGLRSVG
jgi:hypothetical protein